MKITLTLFIALSAITAFSQSVDLCEGNTSKTLIDADDALYFNLQGLNLNSYNWDNTDVNCHINLMMGEYHARKTDLIWGAVSLGIGLSLLTIAITSTALNGEAFGDGQGAAWIFGVAGTGLSIYLFSQASSHKKQVNYHLGEVSEYYRTNNIK